MQSRTTACSNTDLGGHDSSESATAIEVPAPAEMIYLRRENVIRLEKGSGVNTVEVTRGLVWLTGTPATGDMLLGAGDRLELQHNWPYVIQALANTELTLVQAGQAKIKPILEIFRQLVGHGAAAEVFEG